LGGQVCYEQSQSGGVTRGVTKQKKGGRDRGGGGMWVRGWNQGRTGRATGGATVERRSKKVN